MNAPKKSLGQHWLYDELSLEAMCELADVQAGETVVEIGPGLGTLTKKLIDRGAEVIAVEFDRDLARQLPSKVRSDNLIIHNQDILGFNFADIKPDYKVVANIPYYLTSNLVRVLSETENPPVSATLLIQKEVAERLCAGPGSMSLLSVSAQMYFGCSLGPIVPAELFAPPPKVDSQIVHLERLTSPLFKDLDKKLLFRVVKAGFSNRRKTLLNSLSAGLDKSKEETKDLLTKAGLNPGSRPQELSLSEWIKLVETIQH